MARKPFYLLVLCFTFLSCFEARAAWYGDAWSFRKTITIQSSQVAADLTDYPVFVDLSDLDDGDNFFEAVKSDGSDIRVTTSDGTTEVPFEVVSIDTGAANGGELHFKATGTLSGSADTTFYIYYGNPAATAYAATDTYGSENVWTEYYAVWHMDDNPTGTIFDSTSNSIDGSSIGTMTVGDIVTGKLGSATDFDGTDDAIDLGSSNNLTGNNLQSMTISFWTNYTSTTNAYTFSVKRDGATSSLISTGIRNAADGDQGVLARDFANTAHDFLFHTNSYNDGNWHYQVSTVGSGNKILYLDAVNRASDTNGIQSVTGNTGITYIASQAPSTRPFDGLIDEVRFSRDTKDANWITTEYNNHNSASTFYSIGAMDSEPLFNRGWTYRKAVIIEASQIPSDLTDFPIYVDLADFDDGGDFFEEVQSDGRDIRVTTNDGETEVPFELVSISTGATNGGELHFKAAGTLSSTTNTTFYVYYGNSTVSAYPEDYVYGSQNVWDSNYQAVYHMNQDPSGGAPQILDSTANSFDATSAGAMLTGDLVAGQLGNALDFDGTDDLLDTNTSFFSGTSERTISAWVNPTVFATNGADRIFGQDSASATAGLRYAVTLEDDTIGINYRTHRVISGTTLSASTWYHVSVVIPSAATMTGDGLIYIDGVSQTLSDANSTTVALNTSATDFFIGSDGSSQANAILDEVRVSNIARSADWITAEYNNQNSGIYGVGNDQTNFLMFLWDLF